MSPVAKARAKAGGTSHEARTTVEERMAHGTRTAPPWRADGKRHPQHCGRAGLPGPRHQCQM